MDGTLLTSDKQMSDATWAMLDELARRGIEFVPCTGRPLSGIFEPILAVACFGLLLPFLRLAVGIVLLAVRLLASLARSMGAGR